MKISLPEYRLEDSGGRHVIAIPREDAGLRSLPGEPRVPYLAARILLPAGKDVADVEVAFEGRVVFEGVVLEYGRRFFPLSLPRDSAEEPDAPDARVFEGEGPYPGRTYDILPAQILCGYRIALVCVYPVQYFPRRRAAEGYREITLRLTCTEAKEKAATYRGLPEDAERVKAEVLNPEPELFASYEEAGADSPLACYYQCSASGLQYEYVVITPEIFSENFQWLVSQKASGIRGTVKLLEEVLWDYRFHTNSPCMVALGYTDSPPHNDDAARIRNFIRFAYHCWGTKFVLLAGDADRGTPGGEGNDWILPVRGLYPGRNAGSPDAPGQPVISDIYYSCLDGSFDHPTQGRVGYFGEPEDAPDLAAEVYVGRAPVDKDSEGWNFVSKILAYEYGTPSSPVLMVGEQLGDMLDQFGYMLNFAKPTLDEIQEGSAEYAGRLSAGFPPHFSVATLYEKDAAWTKENLIQMVNGGNYHILSHLGHAATLRVMKLCHSRYSEPEIALKYCGQAPVDDVPSLQKVFFLYSEGCLPNAFDNRFQIPMGWGCFTKTDSIGEGLLLDHPNRGVWSFIGNTRFGVGAEDTTDFPAARFHRSFMDALFNESLRTAHRRNIGWALARSREAYRESPLLGEDYMLYTYYELNLAGDPETEIKIPYPERPVADLYLSRKTHWENPEILGTASRGFSPGATFARFEVSYAPEGQSERYTQGLQLVGGGLREVLSGDRKLATWDISQIPSSLPRAGTYDVYLKVRDTSGRETQDSVPYYINRYVTSRWIAGAGGFVDASPAYADLDGDGCDEIIFGSFDGRVLAYRAAGTPLWTSPDLGCAVLASPAVGDLENDGEPEVVVATTFWPPVVVRSVCALRGSNGEVKWVRPFSAVAFIWSTPVLCDLNEDGFFEVIVAVSTDSQLQGLHCLDRGGAKLWHFPVAEGGLHGSPAVGDVDGDGHDDVAFASSGSSGVRVYLLKRDGTPIWTEPFAAPGGTRSSVVLGDIDDDGALEVVFGTSSGASGEVIALEPLVPAPQPGQPDQRTKWRRQLPNPGASAGSLALGDVDGDGQLEVLVGADDNRLYILGGAEGAIEKTIAGDTRVIKNDSWEALCFVTAPALADLDGDGVAEVLFGSTDHYLRAAKCSGAQPVELWRFSLGRSVYSSPAVGDADRDGRLDFAAGCRASSLSWIETEHSWNRQHAPWPTFRHDVRRTGCAPVKRPFRRGDANGDGGMNVSDAWRILAYLSGSAQMPACMDAADANDDGWITSADASYILKFLFQGGPPPPPPYPTCGLDPTEDALSCYSYPCP